MKKSLALLMILCFLQEAKAQLPSDKKPEVLYPAYSKSKPATGDPKLLPSEQKAAPVKEHPSGKKPLPRRSRSESLPSNAKQPAHKKYQKPKLRNK